MDSQEFQFHQILKRTKWESLKNAIYNPDKAEFLGRTKKSWWQLLLFYTIFYGCLGALFAICMQGLTSTLTYKEPKYKLADSLIGTSPGLGFRPMSKRTEEGPLIWYNLGENRTIQRWVALIDEFLMPYSLDQVGKNYQVCSDDKPVLEGQVCTVDLAEFGPCVKWSNYMYNTTSPCVFLKLNRIFGWTPEYVGVEEEMPDELKLLVQHSGGKVWVSCQGESPADRERIEEFAYFPSQGFPGYYFPYTNSDNYLSPLVAVQILHVVPNTIVNIECRAWAKNIRYNGISSHREGSVHFEILVDDKS